MLTHASFTSHNGAQAGMHINISRDAFSSPEHLHRFLTLLTIRPDWEHPDGAGFDRMCEPLGTHHPVQ